MPEPQQKRRWKFKYLRRWITDPIIAVGIRLFLACFMFCSLKTLRRLAGIVGGLACRFDKTGRRLIKENLQVAFPQWDDAKVKAMAPKIFTSGLLLLLEEVWGSRNPEKLRQAMVFPEGIVNDIKDQGIFLITPHLGNWELLGLAARLEGLPLAVVAKRLRNPHVYRLIMDARKRANLEVIDSEGAVRGIVKAIRSKRPVGILVDQNLRPRDGGIFVNFFGLPATCTRAPAGLARKLKTQVMIAACLRTDAGFRIIHKMLPKPVSEYPDDQSLTQDIIDCNEAIIREAPEDYSWLYRRWRYIPADATEEERQRYPSYAAQSEWTRQGELDNG